VAAGIGEKLIENRGQSEIEEEVFIHSDASFPYTFRGGTVIFKPCKVSVSQISLTWVTSPLQCRIFSPTRVAVWVRRDPVCSGPKH